MNRFVKIGSIVFLCGIVMASMSEAKTHQANVSNSVASRNNNSSGSSKGTTHSNSNTTKRSTNSSSTKTTSNNKNNSSSKGTTHSNSNTTKWSTNNSSTKTTSNNKNNSSSKGTTHSNSNTTKRSTDNSSTKTTSNNKNSNSNKGTTHPSSNTTKSPTNNSSPKPTSDNKNSSSNKGATRPSGNVTNQPTDATPNNKDNGNNGGAIRPGGNVTNPPTNNPSTTRNNKNSLGNTGIKWESKSDRPRYKYSNLHPKRIPLKPYKRPTPPRSFRPHRGCPVISNILGLTIGMALDLSMDYLFNKGYIIDRYGDNIVCLRDVNEFGFLWPYVILYYDDAGGLVGSQFSYSTSYYDLSRYNSLYNMLISRYGNPVSTQNTETGLGSTWFGYDNQYISIGVAPMYAENGQLRYYTTLSFGV